MKSSPKQPDNSFLKKIKLQKLETIVDDDLEEGPGDDPLGDLIAGIGDEEAEQVLELEEDKFARKASHNKTKSHD